MAGLIFTSIFKERMKPLYILSQLHTLKVLKLHNNSCETTLVKNFAPKFSNEYREDHSTLSVLSRLTTKGSTLSTRAKKLQLQKTEKGTA